MKAQLIKNLKNLEKLLFFLTILFLPTQLGKHFWPSGSFIYSLRIDYLSPTLYFWDLLILLLYGVLVILWFQGISKLRINRRFVLIFLIFFLSQILSIVNSINFEGLLVRLKDYLIAGMFGLYIASKNFKEVKNYLQWGLLLSTIIICPLAIYQFVSGRSLGLWVLGERSFDITTPLIAKYNFYDQIFLRPYSTFSHPNLLAGFLIIVTPILLALIPRTLRLLKLLIWSLAAFTVLITFSRPALILLLIQSLLFFNKSWRFILILIISIFPLVIVRFISIFNFDSLAVTRRQELIDYSLKLFGLFPIFGTGLNNFINALARDELLVGTSRFLQPVHNIFLLTLSETGVVGLLGFLAVVTTTFWANIKNKDLFSKVLFGNLLTIIFLGLFDHYFLTLPQGQRLFWIIIGLSLQKK